MEKRYLDSLYIISCAIHNKKAILKLDMDIVHIIHECYGQSCELLALSAISFAENSEAVNELDDMRAYLMKRRMKETVRSIKVNKLLGELELGGLTPVVIKGAVLADLYPDPALRESVDTDLFFENSDGCAAAEAFLLSNGGTAKDLKGTGKHSAIVYPGVGTIELHRSLYDEEFHRLHLKNERVICQPLEQIRLRGGAAVTTLGKTDTMKYIFCHMIQHFLFSRCDLRQLCDILLYMKKHKAEIDGGELNGFLERTGYRRAFDTVIGAGIEYLGFGKDDLLPAEYSRETVELFLQDCFNGCTRGVWGKKAIPRGLGTFSVELHGEKGGVFKRVVKGLFPEKRMLKGLYAYYNKNPILLPVAWANNILDLAKGAISNRDKFDERKPLLKKLELI